MRKSPSAILILPFLIGCTGDDVVYDKPDSSNAEGSVDATTPTDGGGSDVLDAASERTPRLLITQTGLNSLVDLAAFNLGTGNTDGRLSYTGGMFAQGNVFSTSIAPFLIESDIDTVVRLDPNSPWQGTSSWSVALTDRPDGGESWANPAQIVAVSPTKAYVLRYNRNRIAVIDPSQSVEAGTPTSTIDLSALLQADDLDGHVDMAGAIFDPVRKRLYVALSNVDIYRANFNPYFFVCSNTKSTVIAIDTTNDALVNLGGSGPMGSVALSGRGVQFGYFGGVTFDAAGDRIIVVTTGCQDKLGDGGPSPVKGRLIEGISLSTNTPTTLLDANAQEYPGQFLLFGPKQALVQFGFTGFATTYMWDPTTTILGPALAMTPDIYAHDGKGQIVGPRMETVDGGTFINVIAVPIATADAGVVVLGKDPFTKVGIFYGNVTLSP